MNHGARIFIVCDIFNFIIVDFYFCLAFGFVYKHFYPLGWGGSLWGYKKKDFVLQSAFSQFGLVVLILCDCLKEKCVISVSKC